MGRETDSFRKFCLEHDMEVSFHEKPETKGCKQAIEARSEALGVELEISSELKTIILEVQDGGNTRLIAIHMPGSRELIKWPQASDHSRSYREFHNNSFSHLSSDLGLKRCNIRFAGGFEYGTLNPVSLFLNRPEIEQFFDSSLNSDQSYYTNTGERTSGVKIEKLSQLLEAIPHKTVSITQESHPSVLVSPTSFKSQSSSILGIN